MGFCGSVFMPMVGCHSKKKREERREKRNRGCFFSLFPSSFFPRLSYLIFDPKTLAI
jgi:hypothetical protein